MSFGHKYAAIYDEIMTDVPYRSWVAYIEDIAATWGKNIRFIMDYACGTGTLSILLAQRGYRVWGVERSPSMLARARANDEEKSVVFVRERDGKFDIEQRFDVAVCFFDVLNYVVSLSKLQETFVNISRHLELGGLFVFDVNTEVAYLNRLFTQSGTRLNPFGRIDYEWRSEYDKKSRTCVIDLEFVTMGNGSRRKFREQHLQRAHSTEEIFDRLRLAGFQVDGIYDAFSFNPPSKLSERVHYVTSKVISD